MNPAEFTISLLQTISWPVVVLIVCITFRRDVTALLGRLSSLKHNNTEAQFHSEKLIKAAEHVQKPNAIEHNYLKTPEAQKALKILDIAPSNAVIAAWTEFELAAREKLMEITPPKVALTPGYPQPITKIIDELLRSGVIEKPDYEFLRTLRNLRNNVLHNPGTEIDSETAYKAITALLMLAWELKNRT